MTRFKTCACAALGRILGVVVLGLVASVGLVVRGALAVIGLVASAAAWLSAPHAETPDQDPAV